MRSILGIKDNIILFLVYFFHFFFLQNCQIESRSEHLILIRSSSTIDSETYTIMLTTQTEATWVWPYMPLRFQFVNAAEASYYSQSTYKFFFGSLMYIKAELKCKTHTEIFLFTLWKNKIGLGFILPYFTFGIFFPSS